MAYGLGVRCLPPTTFWALSLAEFAAMTMAMRQGAQSHAQAPSRARLSDLMRTFPDSQDSAEKPGLRRPG